MKGNEAQISRLRRERDEAVAKAYKNPHSPYLQRMVKEANKKLDTFLSKSEKRRKEKELNAQMQFFVNHKR